MSLKTLSNVSENKIKLWQLEQLTYKCMILVTSLLELNTDNLVIKRIMRSLPLVVLKKNLILTFKKYKHMYGNTYSMDCLKHVIIRILM
jgi:inositol 1,4,5-triphosphate receptor type 1/inositol 1,4,5-triphosphate receptor type 3